jgi:uncharacterized protein
LTKRYHALRNIAEKVAAGSVLTAALGTTALAYARRVEPNWLEVTHVDLTLPRLAPEFEGYRIAQFSDLHMEMWRNWDVLAQVIEESNVSEVDLVAITGDFVTRYVDDISDELSEVLRGLTPRDATVGVLGNHDHWGNAHDVHKLMVMSNIVDVSNDVYTVRRGNASLHIAGVDSFMEARARLDITLDCLPDDSAAILLAHEPDFAYVSAATGRFDLQLSGHSHGGQVRVPILMQMVLPKFSRRYVAGLAMKNGMLIYTNRGLGMSGMQMRFNCRPELTIFTLHAAD